MVTFVVFLLFLALLIILFLSLNVELHLRNYQKSTKVYVKILFIEFQIPYKSLIDKFSKKIKEDSFKDKINDFIKVIEGMPYIKKLCKYSVIEFLDIDNVSNQIDPLVNAFFLVCSAQFSSYINNNFKSIYREGYYISYDSNRYDELDFFIHIKTTVFNLIYVGILYLIDNKRSNYGRTSNKRNAQRKFQ